MISQGVQSLLERVFCSPSGTRIIYVSFFFRNMCVVLVCFPESFPSNFPLFFVLLRRVVFLNQGDYFWFIDAGCCDCPFGLMAKSPMKGRGC